MKVIIRRVVWDDWEAIYVNDNLALEAPRKVPIEFVCEHIQKLINDTGMPVTEIEGERYNIYSEDDVNFPQNFNDIPKEMFE